MSKRESAIIAYVRATNEVARLTKLIGIGIHTCREQKAIDAGDDPEYSLIDCCLSDYYRACKSMPHTYGVDPDYPFLECEICTETDKLIQLRKKARKTLGAAKRQITILGKAAMKGDKS